MAENRKHLYYMSELSDYKISDGYPDVRGWDVKDIDNRVIGKVDNLLVNKEAQRVVYLDVEVDTSIIDAKHDPYGRPINDDVKEFVNKDGENHIIIPIGLVDLNDDSNYVYTDRIDHRTFSETKRYRKGDNIPRDYETQVLDSYVKKPTDSISRKPDHKLDENRIREIVREEIRNYHEGLGNKEAHYSDDDMDYNDGFYDRSEFDDKGFRRRPPSS
ncbi:PRC-barrel domain-containing protein [Mariniflexile sp.]|uniref:PRC-barrel domain-containing protein n=3 Tax=Mariniflexile sp. TaxID=1979402 RepID=UPI004047DE04